jgi:hypothetical protein
MKSVASSLLVAVLGWFAFVQDERPPILGQVSFGVHELGHLLFAWAPQPVTAAMGNGTETLLPLAVGAAFVWFQRDWAAGGICLAWAATTLQDAAVYIADAPYQALPLYPEGAVHDWFYVLGRVEALHSAGEIATVVRGVGVAFLLAALAACLVPLVYSNQTSAARIT